MMKTTVLIAVLVMAALANASVVVSDFSDVSLEDGAQYYNGSDGAGGFSSAGVHYNNIYEQQYGSWSGWAYSKVNDTTTLDWQNQYGAIAGTAVDGEIYAVAYDATPFGATPTVSFEQGALLEGAYFTNTTYSYLSMRDGYGAASKFADGDWFRLTITGLYQGQSVGQIDFYLADFRDGSNLLLDSWQWVDLSTLGRVSSLEFTMDSSDVGDWGVNTPTFFAMDSLAVVPEPAMIVLLGAGFVLGRRRYAGKRV